MLMPSSTRETFIRLFVNSPAQTSSAIEMRDLRRGERGAEPRRRRARRDG